MTEDEKEARGFLEANGVELRHRSGVYMLLVGRRVLGSGEDVSAAVCAALRADERMPSARAQLLHLAAALSLGADAVWEAFSEDEEEEDDDLDDKEEEDDGDEDSEAGPMKIRRT